ncbi:DsrE family protein [Sulfurovum sp.]|uniref:DsrE family protein n=1 Tax=Sulfurovum sp. TaxID=1969726 RepID=UPI0025E2F80E|nr:DsrE family protein [Sulfurovum sp.]
MKKILLLCLCMMQFVSAETEFAIPKPSIDHPRKFVFPITVRDRKAINHVLSSANNVMKFYGPENTEVVIVAYSQGIEALMKDGDRDIRKRVEALMTYDVEFIACGNTMRTLHIKKKDLIDGVEVVTAGIVELIERQLRGYIYIRP